MGLTIHRLSAGLWRRNLRLASKMLDRLARSATRCSIPGSASIGAGSTLAYGGIAVVIHKDAIIGRGVLIGQGITLGAKEAYASSESLAAPTIGDNCYLAAGCRILGGIQVGANSIVAANAVVLHEVPPHSVVAGMPARVVGSTAPDYRAIRS